MKKSLIAIALAASATSAVADNQISDVRFSKYSSSAIEVFFSRPDNWNGEDSCQVQIRQAEYPYTIYTAELSRNLHVGAPVDLSKNQYADFTVPHDYRGERKQIRILCDTANGQVQSISTIAPPPKVSVTLQGTQTSEGVYNVTGGIFVEGNANGTFCKSADEQNQLHGDYLFTDELNSTGGYWAHYYNVQETVGNLYYGYKQTVFECSSEGGTTVTLVEMREGANQTLEVTSEAIYYK